MPTGRRRTGPERHVSVYASVHPWGRTGPKPSPTTCHIRDTLQTAAAFGLLVTGPSKRTDLTLMAVPTIDHGSRPFAAVIDEWLPLTYALNAINRSMHRPCVNDRAPGWPGRGNVRLSRKNAACKVRVLLP